MKKITLLIVFLLSAALTFANGNYKLNDEKIDQLFNNATEISLQGLSSGSNNVLNLEAASPASEINDKILLAWILQFIPVLDFFGVHRYVLGTRPDMWVSYALTCGGIIGIVPLVDWWVLLINGLIEGKGDQYLNNNKFFMWAN